MGLPVNGSENSAVDGICIFLKSTKPISEASTVLSASSNNFMVQRNEFASVVSLTTRDMFSGIFVDKPVGIGTRRDTCSFQAFETETG